MAEVKVFRAQEVAPRTWGDIQGVLREAWGLVTDRSPAEIQHAISGGSRHGDFIESHVDPNTRVGKGLYSNQLFTRPRVAIAAEKGRIVGYAYTANNVSGGGLPEGEHNTSLKAQAIRRAKQLSLVKNYVWIREVAVLPEFQGQGIARQIGRSLLKTATGLQPVSAYVWPDEDEGRAQYILETYGFEPTGEEPVSVFGADAKPTSQVRMEAPSVKSVLMELNRDRYNQ